MKNLYKFNNILYTLSRIFIGLDILGRSKDRGGSLPIYLALYLILMVNDHLRWKTFYKNVKKFYSSMFLSMILGFTIAINLQGYIDIYFYIILYELILFTQGKISNILIGLEVGLFSILILFRFTDQGLSFLIENWQEAIMGISMILLGLLFYCLALFSYRALRNEKRKVEGLNRELEESYQKLKKQSEKLEELTIAKERNRLAGEIHDNLGHSLVALNMNLDVLEKVFAQDEKKTMELIRRTQAVTKSSMEDLRQAVYALKKEELGSFMGSIKELIDNLEGLGNLTIRLEIDEEKIEELEKDHKEFIYSLIKESLTNSIKHGQADEINIYIAISDEEIKINIKDKGLGCPDLVKGNGLLAMERRLEALGGKVFYDFAKGKGFEIDLILGIP